MAVHALLIIIGLIMYLMIHTVIMFLIIMTLMFVLSRLFPTYVNMVSVEAALLISVVYSLVILVL